MKKVLNLVLLLVAVMFAACSSDEPNVDAGKLVVELSVVEDAAQSTAIDYSEYTIVIIPQSGWIYSSEVKDIEWPVDISVGNYKVAAISPALEETANSSICYYGEVDNVRILKDETTSIVINMSRREFPKSEIE